MKKVLSMALIATCSLSLPSTTVQAGDDEAIAAIGGFVVGLIAGSIADKDAHYSHRHHGSSYTSHSAYRDNRVHYPHYNAHSSTAYSRHYSRAESPEVTGRWETRRVKKWIRGYWEVCYNGCGDRIKIWRNGHYRWETERVWVSFCNTPYRR